MALNNYYLFLDTFDQVENHQIPALFVLTVASLTSVLQLELPHRAQQMESILANPILQPPVRRLCQNMTRRAFHSTIRTLSKFLHVARLYKLRNQHLEATFERVLQFIQEGGGNINQVMDDATARSGLNCNFEDIRVNIEQCNRSYDEAAETIDRRLRSIVMYFMQLPERNLRLR